LFVKRRSHVNYGFEDVLLTTDRLELRPFGLEDVDDYFEYASDAEMSLYTVVPSPFTRRRAEEDVAGSVLNLGKNTPNFAIVRDTRVIGDVWLDINRESRVGEIGFSIARTHWGDGMAAEATSAVIEWGFTTERLVKISSGSDPQNRRALARVKGLGEAGDDQRGRAPQPRREVTETGSTMPCTAFSQTSGSRRPRLG
jgi:ribosomal-protein-alanine N-acetyltransferase